MTESQCFPFIETPSVRGYLDAVPRLPLMLSLQSCVEVSGLVDTGASINVLPNSIGIELGGVWQESAPSIMLGGGVSSTEAKGLIVMAQIGTFEPVRLLFAWSRIDEMPVILGRSNFFMLFDVCFYRSQMFFEVRPTLRT